MGKSFGSTEKFKIVNDNVCRQAWLRTYYENACRSFDENITNARSGGLVGQEVYGEYFMSELYTNAYASVKGLDKTCAMLDFVERWFFRISGYGSSRDNHWSGYDNPNGARKRILSSALANKGGRVLVLYGQPGDGKTTFCKKQYMHTARKVGLERHLMFCG